MNIIREQNNENVPLLSGGSHRDNNNVRLNIYDTDGDRTDDDGTDEGENLNNRNVTLVPTCTLTINTNLDKSENENVLNSARPSYQSAFPSPLESETVLKFYGGPVSDALCVPSGEYEVDEEKYIDKINGNNEDPFTLETFKDLIYMYSKKNKDFIIARIKTSDPSGNNKYFYSYYDAHHINKVLFKTQPELSLLHRMQAKNPLNNMIIVGDVHYFVIKADYAKSIFKKRANLSLSSSNKDIAKSPIKSPISYINQLKFNKKEDEILNSDLIDFYRAANIKDNSVHDRHHTTPAYHVEELANIAHKNFEKVFKVSGFSNQTKRKTFKRSQLRLIMKADAFKNENIMKTINEKTCDSIAPRMRRKSDDYDYLKRKVIGRDYSYEILNVVEIENGDFDKNISEDEEDENTVIFRAEFYATDDDFLMRKDVRAYFKKNALEEKDSILFTLSNNITTINNEINAIDSVQHPLLSFINYTFFDDTLTNDNLNVFSSGVKWLLFGYFLFAFLLVKIWISTAVAIFIVLIGVIFMFFLYLLLL